MKIHIAMLAIVAGMSIAISSMHAASKDEKRPKRMQLDTQIERINQKFSTLMEIKDNEIFRTSFLELIKEESGSKACEVFLKDSYGKNSAEAIEKIKEINKITQKSLEGWTSRLLPNMQSTIETTREISNIIKTLGKKIDSAYSIFSTTHYQKRYALELAATYAIGIHKALGRVLAIIDPTEHFFKNMTKLVKKAEQDIKAITTKERKNLDLQLIDPVKTTYEI